MSWKYVAIIGSTFSPMSKKATNWYKELEKSLENENLQISKIDDFTNQQNMISGSAYVGFFDFVEQKIAEYDKFPKMQASSPAGKNLVMFTDRAGIEVINTLYPDDDSLILFCSRDKWKELFPESATTFKCHFEHRNFWIDYDPAEHRVKGFSPKSDVKYFVHVQGHHFDTTLGLNLYDLWQWKNGKLEVVKERFSEEVS